LIDYQRPVVVGIYRNVKKKQYYAARTWRKLLYFHTVVPETVRNRYMRGAVQPIRDAARPHHVGIAVGPFDRCVFDERFLMLVPKQCHSFCNFGGRAASPRGSQFGFRVILERAFSLERTELPEIKQFFPGRRPGFDIHRPAYGKRELAQFSPLRAEVRF
jgi:hypothetical protein